MNRFVFLLAAFFATVCLALGQNAEEKEQKMTKEELKSYILKKGDILQVPDEYLDKIYSHELITHLSRKMIYLKNDVRESQYEKITVILYFSKHPTSGQISALEAAGADVFENSWTPPLKNHPRGFIIARIPVENFFEILALEFLEKIDSGEKLSHPHNNRAAGKINADDLWDSGWKGKGVKVAVLDSGLDTDPSNDDLPDSYEKKDYAYYYDGQQTDDDVENTAGGGHGTHVTGSVLGRGALSEDNTANGGGSYQGMAPEADLVFLKIGLDTGGASAYSSSEIGAMDAAINIYDADILNMSYGGWNTYHDGSESTEQKADWVYDQGAAFFISAGNEANDDRHYSGTVNASSTTGFIQIDVEDAGTDDTQLEFDLIYYDGASRSNLTIYYFNSSQELLDEADIVRSITTESSRGTESMNSYYDVYLPSGNSTWYVKIANPSGSDVDFHLFDNWGYNVYFNNPDPEYTVGAPATADDAFCVGAYTSDRSWRAYNGSNYINSEQTDDDICTFSSRGPRVDGDAKPQLASPGSMIISMRDRDAVTSLTTHWIDNDGNTTGDRNYLVMNGTSMASPICAGAAAQVKSFSPNATPAQIYAALENTTDTDAYTGACPNDTWGEGKLNVQAAIADPGLPHHVFVESVSSSTICAGSDVDVEYLVNKNFNSGNNFTVQLSNASGSFDSPTNLTTFAATSSGTVTVTIPSSAVGTGYRIRLTSSNPSITGSQNENDITVVSPPDPSISGDETVCQNASGVGYHVSDEGNSYSWAVWGGTIASGQNSASVTVDWGSGSSGTVSVIEYNASCSVSDSKTITLNACGGSETITTSTFTSSTFCAGDQLDVSFTASGTFASGNIFNVELSDENGVFTNAEIIGSLNLAFSGTQSRTITCDIPTDATQGSDYRIRVVSTNPEIIGNDNGADLTILSTPNPSISGDGTVCEGATDIMYSVADHSGQGWTYSWSISGGTITTGDPVNNVAVDWGLPGTGTITVVESNGICSTTATYLVEIYGNPSNAISGGSVYCEGDSDDYSVVTNRSGSGYSYHWEVNGAQIVSGQNSHSTHIRFNAEGSPTITCVETSPHGCAATYMEYATVDPIPTPGISGQMDVCENESGLPYWTTDNSGGGNSYTWTVMGGTIAAGQNSASIHVDWGTADFGSLTVTERNSFGCEASATFEVDILENPAPNITGDTQACENETNTYQTAYQSGNSYSWTVAGGTITSGQGTHEVEVNWGSMGNGTITVVENNVAHCEGSDFLAVYKNQPPTGYVVGDSPICQNETGTYHSTYSPSYVYNWTVTGGNIVGASNEYSVDVEWTQSGVGSLTLVTSDTFTGCSSTASGTATVNATPNTEILVYESTVCENESDVIYGATYSVGSSYSWTVTSGTITSGQSSATIYVDWGTAGSGSVTVVQTDINGCVDDDYLAVSINESPTPDISGDFSVCEEQIETYSVDYHAGNNYSWTVTGGNIVSGQGTHEITVEWNTFGNGFIEVEETAGSCAGNDSQGVSIEQLPVAYINGDTEVCADETIYYNSTYNPDYEYSWSVDGGSVDGASDEYEVAIEWTDSGVGTVWLITSDTYTGCSTTVSQTVTAHETPNPVITGDFIVCEGETLTYYTPYVIGNTYSWSVGGGTVIAGSGSHSITVQWRSEGNGVVSVLETEPNGNCQESDFQGVAINGEPVAYIDGDLTICENETGYYHSTYNPDYAYEWSVQGGTIDGADDEYEVYVDWSGEGTRHIHLNTSNTSSGCSTTTSGTITVKPQPNTTITSGDDEACEYDEGIAYEAAYHSGSSYTWYVDGGSVAGSQNTHQITVNWDEAGSASVTVAEESADGCYNEHTLVVTLYAQPLPGVSGFVEVCENESGVEYETDYHSGSSYSWTIDGGTIASGQGTHMITVDWGEAGSGSVTLVETNSHSCSGMDSFGVTIHDLPVSYIAGDMTICENVFGNYHSTYSSDYEYDWYVSGGTIVGADDEYEIDVDWGGEGTGYVYLTTTSTATGCSSSVSSSVTVNPEPNTEIIVYESTVCENESDVIYGATYSVGSSYSWTVTSGTITSGQSSATIYVDWGTAGSGSVTVVETSNLSCENSDALTVAINEAPDPDISGETAVCENARETYSTIENIGNSYTWSIDGGTIVSGQGTHEVVVEWGSTGVGSVTVVERAGSCDNSDVFAVNINAQPVAYVTGDLTICEGETGYYHSTYNPDYAYEWSVQGGSIVGADDEYDIDVEWTGEGTRYAHLTTTNTATGCSSSVTGTITVNPQTDTEASGESEVCENESGVEYETDYHSGSSYSWTIDGGTIASGQGTHMITVDWGEAGSGSVTVIETSSESCENESSITVTINDLPIGYVAGDLTVCESESGYYHSTYNPDYEYEWSAVGGTIVGADDEYEIDVDWGGEGTGYVYLTTTSTATGCSSSVSGSVTINPGPNAQIDGDYVVCEHTTAEYSTPYETNNEYDWSVSGGYIDGSSSYREVDIVWGDSGDGIITLVRTNVLTGCSSTGTHTISINPSPEGDLSGDDEVCVFSTTTLSAAPEGNILYEWSVDNGTIDGANDDDEVSIYWAQTGVANVTLVRTNTISGCSGTTNRTITINDLPIGYVAGDLTVCESESGYYHSTYNPDYEYEWSVVGGTIDGASDEYEVNVDWGGEGTGWLYLTTTSTATGCSSSVSGSVTINPGPNAQIDGDYVVCEHTTAEYSTPYETNNEYDWSVTGGYIDGSSSYHEVDIVWGDSGDGLITLVRTNVLTGCSSTGTHTISINPSPEGDLSGDDEVCVFSTTTLYAAPEGNILYEWSVDNGTIDGANDDDEVSIYWAQTGVANVTLIRTNTISGCSGTTNRTITINDLPIGYVAGDLTVCENESGYYHSTYNPDYEYEWSAVGGTIVGADDEYEIDVDWGGEGTGYVYLTTTSTATGCSSSVSGSVTINPGPNAQIDGDYEVCEYASAEYSTPYETNNEYDWSVTGGYIDGSSSYHEVDIVWGDSGDGLITLVRTNVLTGCSSTGTHTISINPSPEGDLSGDDEVCVFSTTTLFAAPEGNILYEWSVDNGTIDGANDDDEVSIYWAQTGVANVTLVRTNTISGCSGTTNRTITINDLPIGYVAGDLTVCENESGYYHSTYNPDYEYEWSAVGGTIVGADDEYEVYVDWGGEGTGWLYLTTTSTATGCSSSVSGSVTINPGPNAQIDGDYVVCEHTTAEYSTPYETNNEYDWSVSGGYIDGSSSYREVDIVWGDSGDGLITLVRTNVLTGCSSTGTHTISINPSPEPEITGYHVVCEFTTHDYTVEDVSGSSYSWTAASGTIESGQGTNEVTVYWGDDGNGYLSVVETNANGCLGSGGFSVAISPTPIAYINGDAMMCENETGYYHSTYNPDYSYQWDVQGGTIDGADDEYEVYVTWTEDGTGVLTLETANTITACGTTISKNVTVNPEPSATINGDMSVCVDSEHTYSTEEAAGVNQTWSVVGAQIVGDNSDSQVTIQFPANSGSASLTLYQTNTTTGCYNNRTVLVSISAPPQINITGDITVPANSTETYSVSPDDDYEYDWTVTGGAIDGSSTGYSIDVDWGTSNGSVAVEVTNTETGCVSSSSISVEVERSTHGVSMSTGWNMISSYIEPESATISDIFEDIPSTDLYLLLDNTNRIYFHADGSGNLTTWDITQGYRAYMFSGATATFEGEQIAPEDTPIPLNIGWNMIAYLRTSSQAPSDVFEDLSSTELYLALDNTNRIYFHADGSGNLTSLSPGQGYRLYMFSSATLTYDANDGQSRERNSDGLIPDPIYLTHDIAPSSSAAVLILNLRNVPNRWEIGVYSSAGKLIGSGRVHKGRALVSIFGDDYLTVETEAALEGEPLTVKAFSPKDERFYDLSFDKLFELENGDELDKLVYRNGGVYQAEAQIDGDEKALGVSATPNPFSDRTTVEFTIPAEADVKLDLYTLEGVRVATIVDRRAAAGKHNVSLDGFGLASGAYTLVLQADGAKVTEVIMIVK